MGELSEAEKIAYRVLRDWRLSTMCQEDEPSAGYPLVDAVSTPGTDIGTGEEELHEIAYAIAEALATRPDQPSIRGAVEEEWARIRLELEGARRKYAEPTDWDYGALDALHRVSAALRPDLDER